MTKPWIVVRLPDATHVIPDDDWVEHTEVECVCGPDSEPVQRDDGSIGWVVSHHSLDGREKTEEDEMPRWLVVLVAIAAGLLILWLIGIQIHVG